MKCSECKQDFKEIELIEDEYTGKLYCEKDEKERKEAAYWREVNFQIDEKLGK